MYLDARWYYCDYYTFYDLLNLLLSKDCCKEREFGTER